MINVILVVFVISLTCCSSIGQGLDQRTDQLLFELRQLKVSLPGGDNVLLQRFLEGTESYAETIRDSFSVVDATDRLIPPESTEPIELMSSSLQEKDAVVNKLRQTRLHLALMGNDRVLIGRLLENGASLTIKDFRGRTALDYASAAGNHFIITMILDAEFSGPLINGATEMHRGAYFGDLPLLQDVLHDGADVNAKDVRGLTPLHLACQRNREDVVIFLLKHGADCKLATRTWGFPLGQVCYQGMQIAARMMLKAGANVNAAKPGWTPLTLARAGRQDEVCRLLQSLGATESQ
jgi:ankyrin repeat protein